MEFQKEFEYTDAHFAFLKAKAELHAGIYLDDCKKEMVYSRISRIIRQRQLKSFEDYCHILGKGDNAFSREFVNAITTNLTYFFREKHHFDFLRAQIIPELLKHHIHKIRIWSAGCSTGEEPYSVSFSFLPFMNEIKSCDLKILATDIDTDVLNKAENALYSQQAVEKMSAQELEQYFIKNADGFSVQEQFKQFVHFKRLNLFDTPWPMQGKFNIIFCRNVLFYFERNRQNALIKLFSESLADGGYLILGHSESLFSKIEGLKSLANTIYKKDNL